MISRPFLRIRSAVAPRLTRASLALLATMTLAVGLSTVPASGHEDLSPPVIHERFTPLPCPGHPESTLDLEGCAEQRILRSDHQIDLVARSIFTRLFDNSARRRFIAAETAWLAFRQADCDSMSDVYEHGTLAGLVAARCTADDSTQRLTRLQAFDRSLSHP